MWYNWWSKLVNPALFRSGNPTARYSRFVAGRRSRRVNRAVTSAIRVFTACLSAASAGCASNSNSDSPADIPSFIFLDAINPSLLFRERLHDAGKIIQSSRQRSILPF